MIWYFSFQLIGLILLLTGVYSYARYKQTPFILMLDRNIKRLLIAWVAIFIIITIACAKPLYYTARCKVHGLSMNAETKYSWVIDKCMVKTKDGPYVPIDRSRALPGGKDTDFGVEDL